MMVSIERGGNLISIQHCDSSFIYLLLDRIMLKVHVDWSSITAILYVVKIVVLISTSANDIVVIQRLLRDRRKGGREG